MERAGRCRDREGEKDGDKRERERNRERDIYYLLVLGRFGGVIPRGEGRGTIMPGARTLPNQICPIS